MRWLTNYKSSALSLFLKINILKLHVILTDIFPVGHFSLLLLCYCVSVRCVCGVQPRLVSHPLVMAAAVFPPALWPCVWVCGVWLRVRPSAERIASAGRPGRRSSSPLSPPFLWGQGPVLLPTGQYWSELTYNKGLVKTQFWHLQCYDHTSRSSSPSFIRICLPFSSSRALASGYSFSASIRSSLERQNRSE